MSFQNWLYPKIVAGESVTQDISTLVDADGFLVIDRAHKGIRSLTFPDDGTPGTLCLIFSAPNWPFVLKVPRNVHLIGRQPIHADEHIEPGYRLAMSERERLVERIPPTAIHRGLKIRKSDWEGYRGIHQILSESSRYVTDQGNHLVVSFAVLQEKKIPLVVLIRMIRDRLRRTEISDVEANAQGRALIDGVFETLEVILAQRLFLKDLILRNLAQMGSAQPPFLLGVMDFDDFVRLDEVVVRDVSLADSAAGTAPKADLPKGPNMHVVIPGMYARAGETYFGELLPSLQTLFEERSREFFTAERLIRHGAQRVDL